MVLGKDGAWYAGIDCSISVCVMATGSASQWAVYFRSVSSSMTTTALNSFMLVCAFLYVLAIIVPIELLGFAHDESCMRPALCVVSRIWMERAYVMQIAVCIPLLCLLYSNTVLEQNSTYRLRLTRRLQTSSDWSPLPFSFSW